MIEEVQVIKPGGVPIYFNSKDQALDDLSNINYLQASFLSAMGNFATELNYGELRTIVLENKSYLVKKGNNFSLIFGCGNESDLAPFEEKLENAFGFIENSISNSAELRDDDYNTAMEAFDQHLRQQEILQETEVVKVREFRGKMDSLIFRSVGYIPGECNIGTSERYWRLSVGLLGFVVSLVLLITMILLDLPPEYRLGLFVVNLWSFISVLQFYHKFCATNALRKTYAME